MGVEKGATHMNNETFTPDFTTLDKQYLWNNEQYDQQATYTKEGEPKDHEHRNC